MSQERLRQLITEAGNLALSGKPDEAEKLVPEIEKLADANPGVVRDEQLYNLYTLIEQAGLPADQRDERFSWL